MSVSPAMAEGLAATIRSLYGDAEMILLGRIAKALGQGLDAPDWAERKLAELQLVMARARGDLNRLTPRAVEEIVQAVIKAWNRGAATATADAQASRDLVAAVAEGANPAGLPAVQQLAAETASTVVASHKAILRSTEDIYRSTIARTAPQVLLGTQTRREATQTALDSFAAKGISGFTDKSGRRWGMDSYAEMATRTATGHAAIDGHVDRLARLGQDLVIVSDSPRECPACAPWERKVLSLSGAPHVGEDVEIAGTLDEARAAGLAHPSCTHGISAFFPGVTKIKPADNDPEGYAAKQRQRQIERHIREWKRRKAVALDDAAAARADAKIKVWQAEARKNVRETGTKRLNYREQAGKAH